MSKYIEKDFPIGRLSYLAERESWRKEIYRPIYYIHKWWAKRLGSVFRGIILGTCIDEDDDFFSAFYSKNDFNEITVLDPFMGSGVTVGEAVKLGCRVIGRDINPVAVTIVEAALSDYSANDIDKEFSRIERQIKSKVRSYYLALNENGALSDVLYYFNVKYLNCPRCKQEIDLFKSRIFSKNAVPRKDPSARAICPSCGSINHIRYNDTSVVCNICSETYNPQLGNVRGANVTCPYCNLTFKLVDYMKNIDHPLNIKLYAKMVLGTNGAKYYDVVNDYDRKLLGDISKEYQKIKEHFPSVAIEPGYNTNQIIKHNYRTWTQLFSERQLCSIWHFKQALREISDIKLRRLFACLFSGVLEFNNLFCSFKGEGTGAVRHMFSNHILKPELMPIEANIWGTKKSSGSFSTLYKSRILKSLKYKISPTEIKIIAKKTIKVANINKPVQTKIVHSYKEFIEHKSSVYISQGDSSTFDIPDKSIDLVVTDPPFFDNVHYSQLADFFYYWLNQILTLSKETTTRNIAEVQDPDVNLFTKKLTSVFAECNRVLKDNGLFIFTYHHARHEGWVAIHEAVRHAGFICVQTHPIKSEMAVSMPLQQANTPIHVDLIITCKKYTSKKENIDEKTIIERAVLEATKQINELSNFINVSIGDVKVALMGRLLCNLSMFGELERELMFLRNSESIINDLITKILKENKSIPYKQSDHHVQLRLFEKAAEYLANKTLHTDGNSAALHCRR